MDKIVCYACGDIAHNNDDGQYNEYHCNFCGNYVIPEIYNLNGKLIDKNKLKSYLLYHKQKNVCLFVGTREQYDDYKTKHVDKKIILVTKEMVENWYPCDFFEKVDYFLLYLYEQMTYIGKKILIKNTDINSLLFINPSDALIPGELHDVLLYYVNHLKELNYIYYEDIGIAVSIEIEPLGLKRVDEILKNKVNSKKAFVAMQFGDDTISLRDKIKKGIEGAGYTAVLIDEKQYNGQIVPELLYDIRNCKFMVAELSHGNKGAYYEAGYALGLGKEVIHVCSRKSFESKTRKLHFDIAQRNTIIYDSEEELVEKLKKRIEATII